MARACRVRGLGRQARRTRRQDRRAARAEAGTAAGTTLSVSRQYAIRLPEGTEKDKALEYVRLPAKQYNLLDNSAVERLPDDSFRIRPGKVKMMFVGEVEPTASVRIDVNGAGVRQSVQDAELLIPEGSKQSAVASQINKTLRQMRIQNDVQVLAESSELTCRVSVNANFTEGVMSRVPEERLNGLVGWALGAVLPWFLTKLSEDFERWARGDPSRAQMSSGEIPALAARLAAGNRGELPEGVREVVVGGGGVLELEPGVEELSPVKGGTGSGFGRK